MMTLMEDNHTRGQPQWKMTLMKVEQTRINLLMLTNANNVIVKCIKLFSYQKLLHVCLYVHIMYDGSQVKTINQQVRQKHFNVMVNLKNNSQYYVVAGIVTITYAA